MKHSLRFSSDYGIFDTINDTYRFLLRCNFKNQRRRDSIHWMQHYLPILRKYGKNCNHITELGVNQVVSTWAFLAARPRTLISVDIDLHKNPTKHVPEFNGINYWLVSAVRLSAIEGIEFIPIESNDIEIEIDDTDLLFIDTLHRKYHLNEELRLHSNKVSKYIIFHDTVLFGNELNEPIDKLIQSGEWTDIENIKSNPGLRVIQRT
jgi:hypothetical protein